MKANNLKVKAVCLEDDDIDEIRLQYYVCTDTSNQEIGGNFTLGNRIISP